MLEHRGGILISTDRATIVVVSLRMAIALVWLVAGLSKLRSPLAETGATVRRLTGAAPLKSRRIGAAFIAVELILAVALLSGKFLPVTATISAVTFLSLGGLSFVASMRGGESGQPGCGCFGGGRKAPVRAAHRDPRSTPTVPSPTASSTLSSAVGSVRTLSVLPRRQGSAPEDASWVFARNLGLAACSLMMLM